MTPWLLAAALASGQLHHDDVIDPNDYAPCGLNSFYLVCRLLDAPVDWPRAKTLLGEAAPDGTHSFQDIARAAEAVGLHPVGLQATAAKLADLPMPAIVHVRDPRRPGSPPHLLVLLRADAEEVVLLDPPGPPYSLPLHDFATVYTGHVLAFASSAPEADRARRGAWATMAAPPAFAAAGGLAAVVVGAVVLRRRRAVSRLSLPGWARRAGAVACVAVLSLACAGGVVYALLPRERVPCCVAPRPEIDLGDLSPGTFQARVPIRNDGTAPLEISSVRSSCTCAKAVAPDRIEPGETGAIAADLKIGRGPQSAVLSVESDDPAGPTKVTVRWHARSSPVVHPVRVAVTAPANRPYERTIQLIYPAGVKSLRPRLEQAETGPHVTVREGDNRPLARRENTASGERVFGEVDLHVSVKPPGPNSRVETACRLTVRQGDQTYQLGFVVDVQFLGGDVTPETGGVLFTAGSPAGLVGQERSLGVTTRAEPNEVEVSDLPAWLLCEKQGADGGCRLQLRVTRRPESTFAQHTITLGLKGRPASKVPVTIHAVTP